MWRPGGRAEAPAAGLDGAATALAGVLVGSKSPETTMQTSRVAQGFVAACPLCRLSNPNYNGGPALRLAQEPRPEDPD
jgi:hypothetical protein